MQRDHDNASYYAATSHKALAPGNEPLDHKPSCLLDVFRSCAEALRLADDAVANFDAAIGELRCPEAHKESTLSLILRQPDDMRRLEEVEVGLAQSLVNAPLVLGHLKAAADFLHARG